MNAWAAIVVGLCLVSALLVVAVAALYRQVGVLYLRVNPRGPLDLSGEGPPVGEDFSGVVLTSVSGERLHFGDGREALLAFVSPGCGPCERVAPALRTISRDVRTIVVSSGAPESTKRYAQNMSQAMVVVDPTLSIRYQIAYPPFGVYVDPVGRVMARGVANSLEQLDALMQNGRRLSDFEQATGGR